MGSLERKIKRNQQRKAFNELTEEWNRAKRNGQSVNGKELGKKPPFGVFVKRLEAHEALVKLEKENKAKEKIEAEKKIDLEWKDE